MKRTSSGSTGGASGGPGEGSSGGGEAGSVPRREEGTGPGGEGGTGPRRTGRPGGPVVLVGFMASGKSTVGRLLARRLGYAFVDLDAEVERRAGRSIPEIFREEGEATFRELEAEVTRELEGARRVVVAAGGGWMARAELRDRWPEAVRVWLRVDPAEVTARLGGRVASRPMLDPEDPEATVRELLEERRPGYARAELQVDTNERSPGEVADEIVARLGERIETTDEIRER